MLPLCFMLVMTLSFCDGETLRSNTTVNGMSPDCPKVCKCFVLDSELLHVLPTSLRNTSSGERYFMTASCQRQNLRLVPAGLSETTAMLYLAENEFTQLNKTMFSKHKILTSLVLANNKISSIASDTFIDMKLLEYLDLSGNQLETLPEMSFCNWMRDGPMLQSRCYDIVGADRGNVNSTRKTLTLLMHRNPWHCTCFLQQFILNHTCAYGEIGDCIRFKEISQSDYAIAYCSTPTSLREVPLNKLMREQISNPREQVVNLCLNRKTTIDIALFVVLFTWMGITMAYVLNFILWNNREVASHKSYIKTLEQSKQTNPKRQNTKPLDDSTSPPAAKPNLGKSGALLKEFKPLPELAINDKIVSGYGKAATATASPGVTDSPIWKPRMFQYNNPT